MTPILFASPCSIFSFSAHPTPRLFPCLFSSAHSIQQAILKVIAEGTYRTKDLGGNATTTDFTKAVIGNLH